MILTGPEIQRIVEQTERLGEDAPLPRLFISNFNPKRVGPASYDLMLEPRLLSYRLHADEPIHPDMQQSMEIHYPVNGCFLLKPGIGYLGSTQERIHLEGLVATVDGRSSVGRLFVSVHQTAGYIDPWFDGKITIEVSCVQPVWLPILQPVCQIRFEELRGEYRPYTGRYQGQLGPTPTRISLEKKGI